MSKAAYDTALDPRHQTGPVTLPITVEQYAALVDRGDFTRVTGQVELITGRIVRMNPQGPEHADPVDRLTEWSVEQTRRRFTVRVEKPIVIPNLHSSPEPDIAWVTRGRYARLHPGPADIHLLIEVSHRSVNFDRNEKMQLYATAGIPEYWQINVNSRTLTAYRQPDRGTYQNVRVVDGESSLHPLCLPEAVLQVSTYSCDG